MTTLKPLIVWITINCGKFLKRWEYQTTLPASRKICLQVKEQQLEPDMEQWTGSILGKEYNRAVYCHPAYLTSMQNTSCSHEIKRCLLLGRIVMTNLDSILKTRDITLPTKVHLVKFPVVIYGYESWTINYRKLRAEESMLLNSGVGEDSWEPFGK